MSSFSRIGGYSLIEMLVVISVLAILATAAMPLVELTAKRNKERELKLALSEIRQAIDAYKSAYDKGLIDRSATVSGYPPNLNVLVSGARSNQAADGQLAFLLRRMPRDPFARPGIAAEQTWGLRSYASPPERPQPGADVYDVHSTSTEVGMNGVPYSQW
ncbi:type II secretion system protein [Pseudoduganella armeniaca]|uniref:General secretion pathway protein GspG n=1 Tax=Pseudoduganella armeniaca TaxID=2072590 RepID=A0A2R4CAG8_9BURK|nr:type II secretion system protein [Pseudoduganella armeniaca]AVR96624.1 general secretion pathway protein GspG [Pseudoduganella armeniaca]